MRLLPLRRSSQISYPFASADHARLLRQFASIVLIDDEDQRALGALNMRVRDVPKNRDIVREGEPATDCCVILEGLACRYKMVVGGRRQILSLNLPGDMRDLQSLHLSVMDHSVGALTACRVGFIAHEALLALIAARPSVGHIFYRHALVDASIFREWIANVGRRNALERIAHVFCELYARMRKLGLVREDSMPLPLTQTELGDAVGLSTVHVNRVLQSLRHARLIETRGASIKILDWDRLRQAADFDPVYLHLRAT